jgi:hypothetical protein
LAAGVRLMVGQSEGDGCVQQNRKDGKILKREEEGECYVKSMEFYDIGLSDWGLMVWESVRM